MRTNLADSDALFWIVLAVVAPVAIGPFVVAGRVDQRVLEGRKRVADEFEVRSVAARAAVLDVADVNDALDVRVRVISAIRLG